MAGARSRRCLMIDLTRERYETREIEPQIAERYPGGTALATYLLHIHLPPGTDPLSADGVVAFAPGVFAGMPYPGATRVGIAAKSPLTGLWAGGTMGGRFAWALSQTEWDGVVLKGRARELSYLLLDEGRVFFRSAREMKGRFSSESREMLKEWWGLEVAVLCIGPSGESQVRFSTLDGESPEACVRGGLGALFGAKNLKAIAVRPHVAVRIERIDAFLEAALPLIKSMAKGEPGHLSEMDTVGLLKTLNGAYALPSRNFRSAHFSEDWLNSLKGLNIKRGSCPGCAMACERLLLAAKGDETAKGPDAIPLDAEQLWALGPLLDVVQGGASVAVLEACREYGMDPVSLGIVAAWMAECHERKIDLGMGGALVPEFGHTSWLALLPGKITEDPEVRGVLGQGVRAAWESVAPGARGFAMHFRGQELSYMDPRRALWPLSFLGPAVRIPPLSEALSLESWSQREGLRRMVEWENLWSLMESVGICRWVCAVQDDFRENLASFWGLVSEIDGPGEAVGAWGEDGVNLIQTFNWREGWRPKDSGLPERFFEEELPTPERAYPALNERAWRDTMEAYFLLRGWSAEGDPGDARTE